MFHIKKQPVWVVLNRRLYVRVVPYDLSRYVKGAVYEWGPQHTSTHGYLHISNKLFEKPCT